MNPGNSQHDLVVLTADKNMQFAIEGLLGRREALKIRPIQAEFYIHPWRDPGCLNHSDKFLQPFVKRYAHALVIFDYEGCGQDKKNTREHLEEKVFSALSRSGWEDRASAIAIEPELENWVFSDSPEVDNVIGWSNRQPTLRNWLEEIGFLTSGKIKPSRPKEAMEAALKYVRSPRSSALYKKLAELVGLGRCTDPAFLKLKTTLQTWFPDINTWDHYDK